MASMRLCISIGLSGPSEAAGVVSMMLAKRVLVFRDGKIRKDDAVPVRPRASEVLKTLPTLED
jgi:hypothetical protein